MNLKTAKILAIINIFLISFPSHFIYDFFPNTFTSILFPVNESIWEHLKLSFIKKSPKLVAIKKGIQILYPF